MKQLIALETNTLQTFIDNPASITTEDIPLQIAVASHPDTPRNLLEILASSNISEVAEAAHLNATEEILHSLFDTQQRVIKGRKNLPASILEKIFNESPKDTEVPLFLSQSGANIHFFIRQPNTPTWILAEFANINLGELRTYAIKKQEKFKVKQDIEGWIGDRYGGLTELAKHPQVSIKIIEKNIYID